MLNISLKIPLGRLVYWIRDWRFNFLHINQYANKRNIRKSSICEMQSLWTNQRGTIREAGLFISKCYKSMQKASEHYYQNGNPWEINLEFHLKIYNSNKFSSQFPKSQKIRNNTSLYEREIAAIHMLLVRKKWDMMAKQRGKKTILNENTQHLEVIQKVKTLEYTNNI